jgi:hypothetical protein
MLPAGGKGSTRARLFLRAKIAAKEGVLRHPFMEQRFTTLMVPALFHA